MKKKNAFLCILVLISLMGAVSGCSDPADTIINEEVITHPKIEISLVEDTVPGNITVNIIPQTSLTSRFEFAIGDKTDREQFKLGKMDEIITMYGDEKLIHTFDGLGDETEYTIFARAFDENGNAGPIASILVETNHNNVSLTTQFLSDRSAAFIVKFNSTDYYKFDYYFGQETDREAFRSGTLEGVGTIVEKARYTLTYLDLQPNEDRVMFVRAYDRFENTVLLEDKITTLEPGTFPDFEFEVVSQDAYQDVYKFTPNRHCGKIAVVFHYAGAYEEELLRYGNMVEMIQSKVNAGIGKSEKGKHLEVTFKTSDFALGGEFTAYVLTYDNGREPQPFAAFKFDHTDKGFDPAAPGTNVGITVSSITDKGAKYKFSPCSNTMGFYYETVDADWYDEFKETEEWHEYYLHERFKSGSPSKWQYSGNALTEYTETTGEPGKRYYAAVCPMNVNGPCEGGWGEVTLIEYTTESAPEQ